MSPCKVKLPDGKPCPNQVDNGQEYCPFHLAEQVTTPKKIGMGILGVGIAAIFGRNIVKTVVKTVVENIKHI